MMNLYEHQKRALEQTADANRVAYYLDMGSVKHLLEVKSSISLEHR